MQSDCLIASTEVKVPRSIYWSKASAKGRKLNQLTIKACLVNVHVIHPDHHTARSQSLQ